MTKEYEKVKEWKYVKGQRGKEIIMADGHIFHHNRERYYRCSLCRNKKYQCQVKIKKNKERRRNKFCIYKRE